MKFQGQLQRFFEQKVLILQIVLKNSLKVRFRATIEIIKTFSHTEWVNKERGKVLDPFGTGLP